MNQLAIKAYEAAIKATNLNDHAHWDVVDAEWCKIKAKYPLLFKKNDLGTLVGPGWWPALEEAMVGITGLLELNPGSSCQVQQIKEKFGGLRFYVQLKCQANEDAFYAAARSYIEAAEVKASQTCEACGAPGKLRNKSWLKTYCDAHAARWLESC